MVRQDGLDIDLASVRLRQVKALKDPTHTFDDKRFAYLKGHLGETSFPKTAREAWQWSFIPLSKRSRSVAA